MNIGMHQKLIWQPNSFIVLDVKLIMLLHCWLVFCCLQQGRW